MINSFPNQFLQSTRKYNGAKSLIHISNKTIEYLAGNVQDLPGDNSNNWTKEQNKGRDTCHVLG